MLSGLCCGMASLATLLQNADRSAMRCEQDCDGATAMDPKEFAAWFNKGNLQVRLGDFKSALASYTTAADLAPGISGKP